MAHGEKVVGVERAPIINDYIVGNKDDKGMFDGDVAFISYFYASLHNQKLYYYWCVILVLWFYNSSGILIMFCYKGSIFKK